MIVLGNITKHIDTKNANELAQLGLLASDFSYTGLNAQSGERLKPFDDTPNYGPVRPKFYEQLLFAAGEYVVDDRLELQPSHTGFKAVAFKNTATKDVVIAFAGTDGPNIKDWWGNLFHVGWNQWIENRIHIRDYLQTILEDGQTSRIHFTGQSLGGALAQYAIYDFITFFEIGEEKRENLSLVTFNALGGLSGIRQNEGTFNGTALQGISHATHYVVENDIVHRLGEGHIGGPVKKFNWVNAAAPAGTEFNRIDFVEAHRIESAFWRYLSPSRDFFAEAKAYEPEYLNIPNLQKLGSGLGNPFGKTAANGAEALFQLTAGIMAGNVLAPPAEVNELMRVFIKSLRDSGSIPPFKAELLLDTNWSLLFRAAAATNPLQTTQLYSSAIAWGLLASAFGNKPEVAQRAVQNLYGQGPMAVMVDQPEDVWVAQAGLLADLAAGGAAPVGHHLELERVAIRMNVASGWFKNALMFIAAEALSPVVDYIAYTTFVTQAVKRAAASILTTARQTGVGLARYEQEINDALMDLAQGVANTAGDYLKKSVSTISFGPATLPYGAAKALADGFLKAFRTNDLPGLFGPGSSAPSQAIAATTLMAHALQALVIRSGMGGNPFDSASIDPNPAAVPLGVIKEGQVKTFTIFIPYEAAVGGQCISLTLQGSAASSFKVLDRATEISIGADGKFNLLIKEGDRSVTFGLWAKGDVDVDETLGLSATLVDEAGVATHKTHLELNLTLDAIDEGPTATNVINGTPSNDELGVPDSSPRVVNGLAGNDYVSGGGGNDVVDGGTGNDFVLGAGGDDRLLGMDGDDFIVLGKGTDNAQGGAGNDFFGYFGFDPTPITLLYAVGGWQLGNAFRWVAQVSPDPTTGYLQLADVVLWGEDVGANGWQVATRRPGLPNYPVDATNRDWHTVSGGIGNDLVVAGPNDDTLYGDDGDDTLLGMRGDDTIFGGPGTDRLAGNIGDDYIDGGAGNDTIDGEDGSDTLFGGAGNDVLRGDVHLASAPMANHGEDYLDGGDGDDTLVGYAGIDTLFGGEGIDILHGDSDIVPAAFHAGDYLDGEGGNDVLFGYGGDDDLFGGAGLDVLYGAAGNDYLDGEADNDRLFGDAGSDELYGGTGDDELVGGADVDHLYGEDGADKLWGDDGNDTLFGGAGNDTMDGGAGFDKLAGGLGNDTIHGGSGDDTLNGGEGTDLLAGNDGNDVLSGGAGTDTLLGGAGNDVYVLSIGDGADTIQDAEGSNRIRFANAFSPADFKVIQGATTADVVIEYGIAGDILTLTGGLTGAVQEFEFGDGVVLTHAQFLDQLPQMRIAGTAGSDTLFSNYAGARIDGGAGDDGIYGSDRGDTLEGGSGDDQLQGNAGADVLDGGPGLDMLGGGSGNDIYLFGIGSGRDRISPDWGSTRALDEIDAVVLRDGILAASVTLSLDPSTASPVLRLANGVDELVFYNWYYESTPSTFAEPIGNTTVTEIRFRDGTVWDAAAMAAKLNTATSGIDVLAGLATDDVWRGLSGDDQILGNLGDDILYGDNGFDGLSGGRGSDVLFGGADADDLRGDHESDILDGGAGDDTLSGGPGDNIYVFGRGYGTDTIYAETGSLWHETLVFGPGVKPEDITVSIHSDRQIQLGIRGTTDKVLVDAGMQLDALAIDEVVFENGVRWTSTDLRQRISATSGTPGADKIYGTALNDTINAGADFDYVYAGAGDDVIDGGPGGDYLEGGAGSDTYVFGRGSGFDSISDANGAKYAGTGEGLNTIKLGSGIVPTDVSLTRWNSTLNIAIGGGDELSVSEWFDQEDYRGTLRIVFADGNVVWDAETIARRALPHPMQQGLYWGTPGADVLSSGDQGGTLHAGAGNDRLDGGAGVDNLHGGTGNDTLSGSSGNDFLRGDTGNDILVGGPGDDFMDGGDGDDTYLFGRGAGRDRIVESYGYGNTPGRDVVLIDAGILPKDITRSVVSGEHRLALASGDTLTLQGRGFSVRFDNETVWRLDANPAGAITGTALSDYLVGTSFEDVLYGQAGDDSLSGGFGADTLYGGAGNDTLTGGYFGYAEPDILDGGLGNDVLYHTPGASVVFGPGYGRDEVYVGGRGAVSFTAAIAPDQVRLAGLWSPPYGPATLKVTLTGSSDELHLLSWFRPDAPETTLDRFEFANGTTWDLAQITARIQRTGTAAQDYLWGTSGADTLSGASANDALQGLAGNDTLSGGDGDDQLFGGVGDDRVSGNAGNDTLDGGLGNDVIDGGTGDDNFIESEGNDRYVFSRGFGRDTLSAQYSQVSEPLGHDVIEFDSTIKPGDVVVTIESIGWPFGLKLAIAGTQDALTLADWSAPGTRFIEEVRFATGNAVWTVADLVSKATRASDVGELIEGTAFADTFDGLGGDDRIDGYAGNDALYGGAGNDRISGDAGDDIVDGGAGADRLYGAAGNDTLRGGPGDDVLNGSFGNDSLDGGTGADRMLGGAGNDTYFIDDFGDSVSEEGGGGTETVRSNLSFALGAGVENLILTGVAAIAATGNELANVLTGNTAANALTGAAGNDTLDGAGGADVMAGGLGNDIYVVDQSADVVQEKPNEGLDVVRSAVSYALPDNVENLTLTGSVAVNGTGNALANLLTGNSAANVLDGRAGADNMTGGAGNDTYYVDSTADVVTELAGEGTDTVQSMVNYTLGANVENLTLMGVLAIEGVGNALDNVLNGNDAANRLSGGAGNDTYVVDNATDIVVENVNQGIDTVQSYVAYTLAANVEKLVLLGSAAINGTGNSLDNVLVGNSAVNMLTGRGGNDTYVIDNIVDIIAELSNEGTDTVQSSVSYTLGANVENLLLTGTASINGVGNDLNNAITGNAAANTLTGGAGDDTLNGAAGVDTLKGGAGNDKYLLDSAADIVLENPNEGFDTVEVSFTYALGANLENLTLMGTAAVNATGNSVANVLQGNSAANILDGGAGADRLLGGRGNDVYVVDNPADIIVENASEGADTVRSTVSYVLGPNVEDLTLIGLAAIDATGNSLDNVITGNPGTNKLAGGAGNDTYVIDSTADLVIEKADEGSDTVRSALTYTLAANVEKLILTGTATIDGTGNALDNVLYGNSATNRLSGLAGNDTYVVDNTADIVVENANAGTDTVQSSVTYALGANVENLLLTGTAAIDGSGNELSNAITGNAAANVLVGGAGNDRLNGGAGNDRLSGGAGDDSFVVDAAGDVVIEAPNEGTDTIEVSFTYTLVANVENLTLTGTSAIDGTGNDLANILRGNTAANVLNGAGGADHMSGGAGNDIYVVDNAGDAITERAGEGIDTVRSSVSYTLGAFLEDLALTGNAVSGTGNTLANTITGNAAANVLAGGAGDDIYVVDATADVVTEKLNEGVDLVRSSATYVLSANIENLTLTGTAAIDGTGNELNNAITGTSASNQLAGGAGNDSLDGGGGSDTLRGGLGDDRYVVDNAADVVIENPGEGTDRIDSSVTYTLAANVEQLTLTGTAALQGTGNATDNVITGNGGANTLKGADGNDTLTGGAGADTLIGGRGDDTFFVDPADLVMESAGEGFDTVRSASSYALGAHVEQLILIGNAAINGIGNELDNAIFGNSAANLLDGGAGNDKLDGGAGVDFIAGGAGDDLYFIDTSADIVSERVGEGTDTVHSPVSVTLHENVERLTLTGTAANSGTGNNLANIITGNSAANVLDGRQGADTMIGAAGNDTYRVDNALDVVRESANEGIDVVEAAVIYTLPANVENLVLLYGVEGGSGNTLDNVLVGNGAANFLNGGAGNDRLEGAYGVDTMSGGAGDDTYYIQDAWRGVLVRDGATPPRYYPFIEPGPRDRVVENANEGTDTVYTPVSYTLPDNVENLVLEEEGNSDWPYQGVVFLSQSDLDVLLMRKAIGNGGNNNLTGSARADWLEGGAGDDKLQGRDGKDVLIGGAGNDTLDGGLGVDSLSGGPGDDVYIADEPVNEAVNEGTDLVMASSSYILPFNVENLTLTGTAAIDGGGNNSNNVLTGNDGSNVLRDYYGTNTLRGGGGNDLVIGSGILFGDAGNDVLQGWSDHDSISDSAGNNVLSGGSGSDTLTGGAGRELFIGGAGSDTIATGAGADIVAFNRGDGQDVVSSGAGADNTLSFGGGIRYADMSFTKSANNLVVNLGAGDQLTLKDWYAAPANKTVLNMQVIAEAMADFDAASADKLRNRKVVNFDFLGVASAYDAAGAPANWALMNALLSKHLSGSDTVALGADLTYRYGRAGSLMGMGFDPVQGMLAHASFATSAQTLQVSSALDTGTRRLQ